MHDLDQHEAAWHVCFVLFVCLFVCLFRIFFVYFLCFCTRLRFSFFRLQLFFGSHALLFCFCLYLLVFMCLFTSFKERAIVESQGAAYNYQFEFPSHWSLFHSYFIIIDNQHPFDSPHYNDTMIPSTQRQQNYSDNFTDICTFLSNQFLNSTV